MSARAWLGAFGLVLLACGGDAPERSDAGTAGSDAAVDSGDAGADRGDTAIEPDATDVATDPARDGADPTDVTGAITRTLRGARHIADQTTAIEILVTDEVWGASNKGVADRRRIGGRAELSPGGTVATLDGWFDEATGEFQFTFSPGGPTPITCDGTVTGGIAAGGCPRGTGVAGSFLIADVDLTDLRAYCGTAADQFGTPLGAGLITAGGAGAIAIGQAGSVNAALGTVAGGALSASGAGFSAAGTVAAASASGTWTGLGLDGTWTVTAETCPTFTSEPADEADADVGDDAPDGGTRLMYSAHEVCSGSEATGLSPGDTLMSSGAMGCVALGASRELRCWGMTEYSYMWLDGLEPPFNMRGDAVTMRSGGAPIEGVTSIAAGGQSLCWTNTAGEAWCFGTNAQGQLGTGVTETEWRTEPSRVTVLDALAGGTAFVDEVFQGGCARFNGDRFACWGPSIAGGAASATATEIEAGAGVVDAAYTGAVCVVTTEGDVYCWGQNVNGIIAHPAAPAPAAWQPTPLRVHIDAATPLTDVVQIEPALGGVCALRRDSSIVCWGGISFRASLGIPTIFGARPDEYLSIVPATGYENGIFCGADAITSRGGHVCALSDGDVWCFGADNRLGALGTGFDESGPDPAQTEIDEVVQVQVVAGATCARRDDGGYFCWGPDTSAQIPGITAEYLALPEPVAF